MAHGVDPDDVAARMVQVIVDREPVVARHKRLVGGLLAAFFVVIFPGNIAQYAEGTNAFGLDTDRKRLVRLCFQPVLVLAALYGGGWLCRRRDRGDRSRPGPR